MELILYSTNCPRCKVLKMKLDAQHLSYTIETDVDKMLALGIKTAPVLSVNGQMLQAAEAAKWINSQKVGQENGDN